MKLLIGTLAAAVLATVLVPLAGQFYGYHSTAGIWLGFLNLPGIAVEFWVNALLKSNGDWMDQFGGFVLCAVADWAVYFALLRGVLLFKQHILRVSRRSS